MAQRHRRTVRRAAVSAFALVAASLPALNAPAGGSAPANAAHAAESTKSGTTVYIVQMADDPVVAYEGGRAGYAATAPRSGEHANPNSAQVRRYQDFLNRSHADVLRAAGASGNAKFYDYTFSFNGFAAQLTPGQAARLAQQPNVVSVSQDELRQPMTDNTPTDLGLTGPDGLWASGPGGTVGEDVIIGVIDTGIWPEHASFSDETD